jgi:hypothetical protein
MVIKWSLTAKIVVIPLRRINRNASLKLMTMMMYADVATLNTITQSSPVSISVGPRFIVLLAVFCLVS